MNAINYCRFRVTQVNLSASCTFVCHFGEVIITFMTMITGGPIKIRRGNQWTQIGNLTNNFELHFAFIIKTGIQYFVSTFFTLKESWVGPKTSGIKRLPCMRNSLKEVRPPNLLFWKTLEKKLEEFVVFPFSISTVCGLPLQKNWCEMVQVNCLGEPLFQWW